LNAGVSASATHSRSAASFPRIHILRELWKEPSIIDW
jgi:hypothetical protein